MQGGKVTTAAQVRDLVAAKAVPGPLWGTLGSSTWGPTWYAVGGEVGMPGDYAAAATWECDLPPCTILSWKGNIGCWSVGEWEALFTLSFAEKIIPIILKADGPARQGTNWPIDYPALNIAWPGGKLNLGLGVYAANESNFELQSILTLAAPNAGS